MATYPTDGTAPWSAPLKAYIDGGGFPATGQNALTGMWHAEAYGDKTLKTSNVNLAITAVKAAGGGLVYMRAGQWTCDETINMSSVGEVVKLIGAGHTLTRVALFTTSTFPMLEAIGSASVHLEGIGFTQGASVTAPCAILGGRDTTNASVNGFKMKDIYVFGAYTMAACLVFAAEEAHYEDCQFFTTQGAGLVLARDNRGWTITAKWTQPTATAPLSAGNGVIHCDRLTCYTSRTAAAGPLDNPLIVEYAQTFVADSLYTVSGGCPLIVLDKRIDHASFRGVQQEWLTGLAGATEPVGTYFKNTATSGETKIVRVKYEACALYQIFGDTGVSVTNLEIAQSSWRASAASFQIDIDLCDMIRAPQAGLDYFPTSASEVTTPAYRRRTGTQIPVDTPVNILRASTTQNPASIPVNSAADATVTVTGAVVGEVAYACYGDGTSPPAGCTIMAWVSAANTVTVRWLNTGTIAVDPASVTVKILVFKFA